MTQYVDYTNLHVSPRVNMPHLDMEGFIRRRSGIQTNQIDPAWSTYRSAIQVQETEIFTLKKFGDQNGGLPNLTN